MPVSMYSAEEWLEHKPLIENLYSERGWTMNQVRDHLRSIGFHVNHRMVKTRIINWDLHKNLHLPEMRAALKMLGPDRSQWPSPAPRFRIRRRVIELDEILRSYGRKGIWDPFEWIRTTPDDDYEHFSNVELLGSTAVDSEPELDGVGQSVSHSTSTSGEPLVSTSAEPIVPENPGYELLHQYRPRHHELPNTVHWPLRDPKIYIFTATAIHQVESYCLTYMRSDIASQHREPEVHHFTSHARFQDRMYDGISLFVRGEYVPAFDHFDLGFAMLKDLLVDLHPMATAIYLLLLCKLTINKVTVVADSLLRQTFQLACTIKGVPHHVVELLAAILQSGELLEIPLLCLRAASDVLEASSPMHWKSLYVKERHCDALFNAKYHGEVATRRVQLLKSQEARYGPSARNVLWTSLNVADDHLVHGQLAEAEARYAHVMQLSEQHSGFHRAKSRVVALEGLAKVAYIRACKPLSARADGTAASQSLDVDSQLQRALELVEEALQLAQIWFEASSRRIQRLFDMREEIRTAALASQSSRSLPVRE